MKLNTNVLYGNAVERQETMVEPVPVLQKMAFSFTVATTKIELRQGVTSHSGQSSRRCAVVASKVGRLCNDSTEGTGEAAIVST
jgi:hypothetical protein